MSGIITLTTDWSNSDYYIGAIKAKVLAQVPNTQIVDISHNIESYSIAQAAFIIKSTFNNFPKASIHIIAVDSEPDENGKILIIEHSKQYFILNDNGAAGLIFDSKPKKTVLVETGFAFDGASFTEYSIYTDIAIFILKGGDISQLGDTESKYKKVPELLPQLESHLINGEVIYIDSFGNAITNIHKNLFREKINGSSFEIFLNSNFYKSDKIHNSYKQVKKGEIISIFNSLGLLEIAIREGNASQLLSLKRKSEIRIKYES